VKGVASIIVGKVDTILTARNDANA
jgi:hypothetical protein